MVSALSPPSKELIDKQKTSPRGDFDKVECAMCEKFLTSLDVSNGLNSLGLNVLLPKTPYRSSEMNMKDPPIILEKSGNSLRREKTMRNQGTNLPRKDEKGIVEYTNR